MQPHRHFVLLTRQVEEAAICVPQLDMLAAARSRDAGGRINEHSSGGIGLGKDTAVIDKRKRRHHAAEQQALDLDERNDACNAAIPARRKVDTFMAEGPLEDGPPSPLVITAGVGPQASGLGESACHEGVPLGAVVLGRDSNRQGTIARCQA